MDTRENRLHALHRQVDRLSRHITAMQAVSDRITRARLFYFLAGAVIIFFALGYGNITGLLALVIVGSGFWWLVRQHQNVKTMLERFQITRTLKREHIARMTLDWDAIPPSYVSIKQDHPYARDIDVVGEYGLHRLLDTTITRGGSHRLLSWLLSERPKIDRIHHYQALGRDLIPLKAFREGLRREVRHATNGKHADKWDGRGLVRWLENHAGTTRVPTGLLPLLVVLSVTNIVLLFMASAGTLPPIWVGTFAVYLGLSGLQWSRQAGLFNEAMELQGEVAQLRAVLRYLERYPYGKHGRLREVCAPFADTGNPPSAQLRRIGIVVSAASLQRNPVVWLMLNAAVPWDIFFASLLGQGKRDLAQHVPGWLDTWYELEAASALATFAYLNPHYTFPTVTETGGLQGDGLGHPLIPHEEKVCNDFGLHELGQVVIITGSNMSGKSSFLRTIGLNMTLAYAGGVVNAEHMRVGLFRLFTCVRVSDSVVDGISYFYAEVKRLRALLEAIRSEEDDQPVFFLIDEIFRGTNNRERLIGSRSYIQALVGGRSMGLISTHDLELVTLADDIPQVSNYHFKEHIEDGRMAFDYRLRRGPSPTTNALQIMELEGLPVETTPS